jgi:hypothetical protein
LECAGRPAISPNLNKFDRIQLFRNPGFSCIPHSLNEDLAQVTPARPPGGGGRLGWPRRRRRIDSPPSRPGTGSCSPPSPMSTNRLGCRPRRRVPDPARTRPYRPQVPATSPSMMTVDGLVPAATTSTGPLCQCPPWVPPTGIRCGAGGSSGTDTAQRPAQAGQAAAAAHWQGPSDPGVDPPPDNLHSSSRVEVLLQSMKRQGNIAGRRIRLMV